MPMDRTVLEKKALAELRQIASTLELRGYQRMKKADLVDLIIAAGGGGNGSASSGGSGSGNGSARAETSAPDTTPQEAEEDGSGQRAGTDAASSTTTDPNDDATRVRARRRGGPADASGSDRSSAGDGDRDGRARNRARQRDDDQRDTGDRDGRDERDRAAGGDQPAGGPSDGPSGGDDAARRSQDGAQSQPAQQGPQSQQDQSGDDGGRSRSKRERRRKSRPGGPGQGQQQESLDDAEVREGVLDLLPEGYGFLRVTGYLSGDRDVYVSQSFVRRFDLRRGDRVSGPIRRNKNNDKFPALARVDAIEGEKVEQNEPRPKRAEFKDLTPLFPTERLRLEITDDSSPIAMRLVDMMAPIGKGQRGLLVSPPKAGKTTVLKQLAHAIEANDPDVHVMVLLVDERPEEVTDFERSTQGEVVSSTFDRPAEDHTQVAELTIERAKRLVERGRDVVILLDSITRLGRAYNLAAPPSGRILSGGIDSAALYPPKRFFGAARNIEDGGSLTIIATALIETGSKMDEVIFEEFKGTGNMELRLDRRMEQKRIFPAIDIQASGTRREELLLHPDELKIIWKLRRLLSTMDSEASLQLLIDKLKATKSNAQFLQMIGKSNLS